MAMENMENKKMEGDFAAMLDASMEDFGVHPGKLVKGKISQVDKEGVFVDFGYTRDGLIAWKDWAVDANGDELMNTLNVGDEVEAVVMKSARPKSKCCASSRNATVTATAMPKARMYAR